MDGEENLEQVAERDQRRVEGDLHNLGMASRAVTDFFIAGVADATAGIARNDAFDALEIVEHGLQAPETAAGQRGNFASGRWICHSFFVA